MYAKDLNEPKYEFLIKKRENAGIKHLNDPNAFIECSNTMDDVYDNIDDYNPSRKKTFYLCLMIWFQTLWATKNFMPYSKNCLLGVENPIFHSFLSLFICSERYQIKFNTLIDYENQQQKRITKYCN